MNVNNYYNVAWNVTLGREIIFSDEDDDEKENKILEKIDMFGERTVPQFNSRQFKENFQMNPNTFEDLLRKLHRVSDHEINVGHPEINLKKQAMIGVWCLANIESFRSISQRFGVSKSTCWSVLNRFCMKVTDINQVYKIICWPNEQKAENIIQSFQEANGFPGVIGWVDGTHVQIMAPKRFPNSYYNRKKFHSVLIQGTCDNLKLFTDIYTGEPGSIHDSRLFQKSPLDEDMQRGHVDFPNNSHLVGDLAYRLSTTLLVGFKNYGNLTDRQKNFNFKLSQIRVIIENAYALLKGRFRRLKFMETFKLDIIGLLIMSARILHNFCILKGDNPHEIMNLEHELAEEQRLNAGMQENVEQQNNGNAIQKRNNILNNLDMPRNIL